jgi:hypothetical protein
MACIHPSRAIAVTLVVAVAAACGPDRATAGPGDRFPHAINAFSGNQQIGAPGMPLEQPIAARVVDDAGSPVANAPVDWSADDGGSVAPSVSSTDNHGVARATWTLGATLGLQHAHASSASGSALTTEFRATAFDGTTPVEPIVVRNLDTPEGSGQTVHPDLVAMPANWHGATAYLAITPYPNGNASYENPSIFASSNAIAWKPPFGIHNPVASPVVGHLSDPDAVYVPERDELWVYFRAVESMNVIRLTRSADGTHFSDPVTVAQGDNHTIVSPAIVRRSPTDWLMWSVNSNIGCSAATTSVELRRSTNGLAWSAPRTVALSQPGLFVWHIDVQWIPSLGQYWAIYNAKTPSNCTTPALYLATSADGINWHSYPSPLLVRGVIPEFEDVVYRSSLAYDPATDIISFWYSGARYETPNYIWHSAFQRRSRAEVFTSIAQGPLRATAIPPDRPGVPPLLRAP